MSLEDGLKISNYTLGSIYKYAHSNSVGNWHIVRLTGRSILEELDKIQRIFPQGIDAFRWQVLTVEMQEVHVYIHQSIFNDLKTYISGASPNRVGGLGC
ncbi:MAG: hypothetical protein P8011_00235 [Acidihalobacter sp.]|uniref:hypothetical protein n=1 Tax=Acidihalobacter sp. TaxID=1872108 RepID=UPI00307E92F1